MNDLIDTVFGDPYITLQCDSGECLHYTQVPGYQRPERPDNSTWVAVSVAAACAFVLISALGELCIFSLVISVPALRSNNRLCAGWV